MDERVLQFRVGVMVVATVFIAGLLVTIFNYSPWLLRGRYVVYAKFVEAPGIEIETPVRKSGVLIGRVTDVRLRESDVVIAMRIDSKYKLYQNEICRVGSQSLLGDPLIEFVAPPAGQLGPPLTDGALIEGQMQVQPLDGVSQALTSVTNLEDDVVTTLSEFRAAAQKVNTLADHLNVVAVNHEEEVSRVIQKTEAAMDNFNSAMTGLGNIVGDRQVQSDLKASVAGVPTMVAQTQIAMEKFGAVADRVNTQLDTVQPFTESLNKLSNQFEDTGPQVEAVLTELEALARDLRVATAAINEQKGTLGKLVHSPELYQRLNYAAANIECVSGQLQPIVNDVRVFTDKIARDPGRLGVKGALTRGESGTKFLPMSFFYGGERPSSYSYHWSPTPSCEHCAPALQYEMPQYELPPNVRTVPSQYNSQPATMPQPAAPLVSPQAFWRGQ
jgi:phospholipid/cholesterol/gamma-HCH transport system substrate-binding protein